MLTSRQSRSERIWGLPAVTAPGRLRTDRKPKTWRWSYLAALSAWGLYSVAAVWMAHGLHYQIGDSMARIADARHMLFGRDPHLAAIGLYWMPLPAAGQLPFMLVLSPLHHAELSGPLATAFAGALTVLVIARICRVLELSRPVSAAFTLVYAFNPIVVWTAANAMSEQWSFLGCAVALLGYIRWSRRHRSIDLAVLAVGLSIVMLARYEGLLFAPIMAAAAAVNDGQDLPAATTVRELLIACRARLRQWLRTAAIIVLPTYYVFGLWLFMQYVIARDPLFWYKEQKAIGKITGGDFWLPAHLTIPNVLVYCAVMSVVIAPALAVVGPLLVMRRRFQSAITGVGLLAGALMWPAIVVIGLILHESAGAPRYFEPIILFMAVGAMWLAADFRPRTTNGRRAIALALIGVLAAGALGGTAALDNPTRSGAERENVFFGRVLGHNEQALPENTITQEPVRLWRAVVQDLDPQLGRGSKVLVDASVDYGAFVLTRYPDHYISDSDRDYLSILSNPAGRFDYIMVRFGPNHRTGNLEPLGPRLGALQGIMSTATGGRWIHWKHYPIADIYHWEPDRSGVSAPSG